MSEAEEKVEKVEIVEEVEEEFKPEKMLIEGCIDDQAKEVFSQMLARRLAELDPTGLKAKFILRLQNELNAMPSCKEMVEPEAEKTE